MQKKAKFVRPAKLPKAAYKTDLKETLGPYMAKAMGKTKQFLVQKKADDHTVDGRKILRLTIGGNHSKGYYIVYRGELSEVRELLGSAFRTMAAMNSEPEIMPEKK